MCTNTAHVFVYVRVRVFAGKRDNTGQTCETNAVDISIASVCACARSMTCCVTCFRGSRGQGRDEAQPCRNGSSFAKMASSSETKRLICNLK